MLDESKRLKGIIESNLTLISNADANASMDEANLSSKLTSVTAQN
jgi:hypothetical protein